MDKPKGPTSHDAVLAIRGLLGGVGVGHTGTLDPMATGLLVMCVGAATKLSVFLSRREKEYTGTITFGTVTDSLDATGDVVESRPVPTPLDREALTRAMRSMVGELTQVPPMTSAVKVGGRRLHKLARRGVEVERKPRVVRVTSFDLLGTEDEKAHFRVVCSTGTYVRCLASDLGGALGWGAHLSELRRTRVGRFVVGDALPLSDAARLNPEELVEKCLIPAARAVDFLPSVVLDGDGIRSLSNGGSVSGAAILKWDVLKGGEPLRVLDEAGTLKAVGTSKGRESDGKPASVSPVRVLVD